MSQDVLRIIDGICRDKNIDRDTFVADLESAMAGAIRKTYDAEEDAEVKLDLLNGNFTATMHGKPVDINLLGRIGAQIVKQVIKQKTHERERASIFQEFTERRGTIITGTVVRADGGNLLVNIGRTDGFLPRSEQIPGETHQVGERIRTLILEAREQPNQVKIILSRSNPELILRLFELEVPEVAERIIEIKALAREAGYRTKVAVSSIDSKVDAVGACVGVRGSRIRSVVDELGGEKIDIVRWNESSQILIQNSLKPAEVQETALCFELGKATVMVIEDQLSLAIGKRGQNVRLAARLTGWDIDILTPEEYNKHLENLEKTVLTVEGVTSVMVDKLIAMGCVSVSDVDEIGPDPLVNELDLDPELAARIVQAAGEEATRLEEEREQQAQAKLEEAAAAKKAEAEAKEAQESSDSVATQADSGFVDEASPEMATDSDATEAAEAATEPTAEESGDDVDSDPPEASASGDDTESTSETTASGEVEAPPVAEASDEPATEPTEPTEPGEADGPSAEAPAPAPEAD